MTATPADTPAEPLPRRHYPRVLRILAPPLKAVLRLLGSKDWHGTENLHRPGGMIVAANHITELDPVSTAHVLYNNGLPPRIMAKAELFRMPVLGRLMYAAAMIPVERGTRRAADALVAAHEALAEGDVVLIFPEGTLTKDPNQWPMVGHPGVARMALTTGAPVIPLAQWGPNLVVRTKKPWFTPLPRRKFQAMVGEPVNLSDLMGRTDPEVYVEATARIMSAITVQLAELRGEAPPEIPFDRRKVR